MCENIVSKASSNGRNLDLSNLQLDSLPIQILELKDSLEFLNLSGNRLSSFPDWFGDMKKLRTLFVANNLFEEFPRVLKKLNNLFMLSFRNNSLTTIHDDSLR